MLELKIRITGWVLNFANKFPRLVSKRLQLLGGYAEVGSVQMKEIYRRDDSVLTSGLFEGNVSWKGLSFIAAVDRSDLEKIHKWMNSQKRSPGNYSERHEVGVNSTDLVGASFNNLGMISFGRSSMYDVGTVSIVAKLPVSCYVTLLRLKGGVYYLSLYVSLDELASKHISEVDVSYVKRHKVFQSLNPFSSRFSVVEHHDRRSNIEEVIYRKSKEVVGECKQAISALLKVWGVKKDISEFSTGADFFREGAGSYFCDTSAFSTEALTTYSPVVHRWQKNAFAQRISEDSSEDYIENYIPEKIGIDAIFIKSQVTSETERNSLYVHSLVGVTDYYSYLLIVDEIYSRFKECMHKVSPVFLNYNKKAELDLARLMEAALELNILEEKLTAVEEGLHWNGRKYLNFTRNRIFGIRAQVASLRGSVEKRRDLNNGGVQASNLIWMRRYSKIVFVLVVVQIALSLLNVDWTETGRDKNPIYINLFRESK